MVDPGLILGGISAVPKAILGTVQAIKGQKELDSAVRPQYEIPEEIKKNLSIAERMTLEGLPSEQKQQYIENLNKSVGATLSGFTSRKAGLSGLTNLVQSQNEAYKNLMVEDAAARQRNELQAIQQRETMAGYKDKAFQMNEMQPYEEQVAEGQALVGSGIQNIAGAFDQLGGVGQQAMTNKLYQDLYGNNQNGGRQPSMDGFGANAEGIGQVYDYFKNNPGAMKAVQNAGRLTY